MIYGFMGIWTIEIVKMTAWKKLTPEKVVRDAHQAPRKKGQYL